MSRTAASSRTALIPSLQTDVRIWNVMSDSAAPTIETRNDTTFALLVIFLAVLNTLKLMDYTYIAHINWNILSSSCLLREKRGELFQTRIVITVLETKGVN